MLGMSQPNFNHALHNTGGKRFTIEQIYDITRNFDVSIDWLMGNQNNNSISISPRSAARFIINALSSGAAKLTSLAVSETVYSAEEDHAPREVYRTPVKYWAVYFPSYRNPEENAVDEEDLREKLLKAKVSGNQTPFLALNNFLEKYLNFCDMLQSGHLDEEDFQTLVKKHLEKIQE